MRRMRKAVATLAAVCILCSTYGNQALAIEKEPLSVEGTQPEFTESTESEPDLEEHEEEASDIEKENEEEDTEDASEDSSSEDESNDGEEVGNSDDVENTDSVEETEEDEDDVSDAVIEETEEADSQLMEAISTYAADNGDVSRIEWITELVNTFEMSVTEDNYPDNYYSDVDSSSTHYRNIMIATEFGLIDVEAGEEFCPDNAATREFAAHTLNFCLGFLPEEESNYTYNESADVTYADDIQVAVERGWFLLKNGNFQPEAAITSAEKSTMITDAKSVLADRKRPTNHSNSYTFAKDVIDLTQANVRAEMTDDNVLAFYECSESLSVGNKYGLEFDGFPTVFKAVDVTQSDGGLVVQFENVPLDEAFSDIDMHGGMNIDLAMVQAYSDDVELHYIVGGTEEEEWEDGTKYDTLEEVGNREISAVEAVRTYSVSAEKSHVINLAPGVKITVSCKVSDVKPDYEIKLLEGKAHVGVNAKVIFNCNVSAEAMAAAGISPTLELVRIPIACVGYFGVKTDLTMSGEATLNLVGNVSLGLYYEYGGFRMERGFTKESFTLQTRMEISATVTATLGMNACNIMQGELYAKFGAKDVLDSITYGDGKKPTTCAHQSAWLFASAGGYAQVKLGSIKPWSKTYPIYSEKNSPVRVSFHYEDGVAVSSCTRGTLYGPTGKRWGYYTPVDSKYGYNGASKGTGANGEPYTIFEYTLDGTNRATITKYQGNVSALSIPKTLDGYTVVKIGSSVFANNKLLQVVAIPDGVVEIGNYAFRNCSNLSQVTLPKNLATIGGGAFYNCDALAAIEIPKSLKAAYSDYNYGGPFANCDGLKNVTFEKGTIKVARDLFDDCSGIEEIEIPDTITEIEVSAFYNCSNLKKVRISNSVTKIQNSVFSGCIKLTEINIPEGVTELGNRVFENCSTLPKIMIPDSVTGMGTYIFSGCSNLQEATLPNAQINIAAGTFKDCPNLEKVNFPETLEAIRSYAFYNTKLTEVDLPKNLTTIESYAFYNCDALCKVSIPDSVTTLGTYVLADCESLSDVTLGTGITTIPSYAFQACPSLQKIVLPYRTATISSNAFTNCTSLMEITIPRATTTIASSVFSYPSRLTIYGIVGTYAETYANNIGATFVNQELNATEIKLNTTDLKLTKGSKTILNLNVMPTNFTDRVMWKSADTKVASVDDAGVVSANTIGTTTIKVTVGDLSATCKITVTQPITSISLNKTSLSMEAFATEKLTATVSPSAAENKTIIWSTSNNRIASVNDMGVVTAHTKGTATITAKAQDGSGISKKCTITVLNNGYLCSNTGELESPHNYPVNCSDFWLYTKEGAERLYITFDERTKVEESFDFLYLYDGKGKQIGKYTGTQLAGQVLEILGDTVKIKLVSDDEGTAWGFKVTHIMGTGEVENDEYLVTFDSQGGTVVSVAQVENGKTVLKPVDPDKKGYEFLGWYLGDRIYDFSQPVTKNIVLQAKWRYIVPESDPAEIEPIPVEDIPEDGIIPDGLWIAGVKDQSYTGKAIKPEVRVYDGSTKLKEKIDYTISYKNNIKANDASNIKKAPTITVKGKGNYVGLATATFKINAVNLDEEAVCIMTDTLAYNKKIQKKVPIVKFLNKKLSLKRDYTVTFPESEKGAYQEVGTYPIQLTGVGNFTGTKTVYLNITDKILIGKAKAVKIPDQCYNNGEEILLSQTALVLYMKSKRDPLVEGIDYSVDYNNNREIGTATIVITGMGKYAGTKCMTFKIKGTAINRAVVTGVENKVYNGTEQRQNALVKVGGNILTLDKDYKVTYNKNKNVGTANLTIQGIGAYSGTVKKSFKIMSYDLGVDEKELISELEINQGAESASDVARGAIVAYSQGGCQPQVTLKFGEIELVKGKDYTITYQNNKNVADASSKKAPTIVIKGKGNFKGRLSEKFSIVRKNIADAENPVSMNVTDVAFVKGAGKYVSKPVLTDTNGKTLKAGTDYDISYTAADGITRLNKKSVVNAGSYVCVTVRGKGKYEGSLMTTYRITQANFTKASVKIAPQTYTGSRIYLAGGNGGDISVRAGKTELTYGVDYEILEDSYVNNVKKGTASVKIRGINNYGGTKTVKFKIQAKKMESFSSIVKGIFVKE